ncbi:MAG: 2-amino-4-hydroxy-6-hydroxymethyldihydropteridine diphosphokinase [Prevotellaceae bacterium]|jgi:2-amino-4-hydroxy-6-hydroxymethyldihydropteridine diphosphokinase|nr:2-amino-4-hydroxy-6-hydroxymethyldihydropteridine diphosphokinase [Prevotellaceae bacterium]
MGQKHDDRRSAAGTRIDVINRKPQPKRSTTYLLLGSDTGDREKHINDACNFVKNETGNITAESSMYISEAWGFDSDLMFFNKVIAVETELNVFEILNITQKIELKLGRTHKTAGKYQSRIIDIDILFYDDKIIKTSHLEIPHPQIPNRRFTLLPLSEIAPDFIHPALNKSISQMLADCKDDKKAERIVV